MLEELKEAAAKATGGEWECFQDASYYDMWCVRKKEARAFNQCFHLVSGNEAVGLRDLLNERGPTPEQVREACAKEMDSMQRDALGCREADLTYEAHAYGFAAKAIRALDLTKIGGE